ncbi:spermatogenesis-associated protein 17 [Cololabis saira]|uniref:spermatogenesis-associated protein 17 n=1 Tax=Cololabis saira TaxID=129043 RepID=UPI002AD44FAE|nr:spermatogenesis-associated protein 17 [Cololabis saira]
MEELLKSKVEEFKKEYFYRHRCAEENRQRETEAAIRIQSWFRGSRVRAYLSHLHKKTIIIQKIWRGFTARARVRQMVKAAYFIMKMNFYNEMAVRIQKRWRGFFVRKYIHNFYARKSYFEGLLTNGLTRKDLDEFEEFQKREIESLEMAKQQRAKVYQAQRSHYLLSTIQCPGVFNSPFRSAPHEMELLLRQVKSQAPSKLPSRSGASILGISDPATSSLSGTIKSQRIKFAATHKSRPVLPPIASKKNAGDDE